MRLTRPASRFFATASGSARPASCRSCSLSVRAIRLPPRCRQPAQVVDHELVPVLLVHFLDLVAELALEPGDPAVQPLHLIAQAKHGLDAREIEPELGREALDQSQTLEVALGVEPRVPGRPLRPHEPLLLVDPQRLRVHADDLGGDADHVARPVVHQLKSMSRGLPRSAFCSSTSASRSAFVSFFGTSIRIRASTSPLPEPESFGAPRPRMRSSFPSSEPAGTFSVTGPSGVGTSTFAPSAASLNVTGTLTTRSASRRS